MKNFYISYNLNKFINIINAISDKKIEKLVRVFDEIQLNNKNNEKISLDKISFTELIKYLEEKKLFLKKIYNKKYI